MAQTKHIQQATEGSPSIHDSTAFQNNLPKETRIRQERSFEGNPSEGKCSAKGPNKIADARFGSRVAATPTASATTD